MLRKFPLTLIALCIVTFGFSQEKLEKTYYYTSSDTNGYISIQKINSDNADIKTTTLNTTVKATFENEVLNFTLSTINDSDKMVAPNKISFHGTIDATIKPVQFTGNRIKKSKKKASYWYFDGDFVEDLETDPDFKRYAKSKHNSTLKIPDRTLPSFNLWAVVPNLPFDRKGTFKFNTLDETKLYVSKKQTVNYLGKYKSKINGEIVELHKFVHQGKGMIPAYYWVNDSRELVQVLLDGKFTFTLSSREAAMQTVSMVY